MAVKYSQMPSVQQFKKDSSIFLADRSRDRILLMIDRLLIAYPIAGESGDPFKRARQQFCLAQLWFACDYWLKIVDGGKRYPESANMNAGRRPVIYELYKCIVNTLMERTSMSVNKLPEWLIRTFGRGMGDAAVMTDLQGKAIYLCAEDLRWYRLHFMSGLAFQHQWWENSSELIRADSKYSLMAQSADERARAEGCSGYVLGMGQDFYMAPHFADEAKRGDRTIKQSFYHSSYLGGRPVLCAGTMKIENGEVRLITSESGHYRPSESHLLQAVNLLSLFGVRMDRLSVRAFGKPICSGERFLATQRFEMTKVQDEEENREMARMKVEKKLGDDGRRARPETQRVVTELMQHIKQLHKGKRDFKCAYCKRFENQNVMEIARWALANEKSA